MKKYDLIVVGGGVLGTFHAYHAARKGKKVLILEKDNRPVGSTVQNFGQVVPSGLAGKWFDLGLKTLEIYKEIQQKTDVSITQQGSVYIASDEAEWQVAQEMSKIHQDLGYENQLLDANEVTGKFRHIKSSYARGGIFYPGDMSVEPHLLIYKLLEFVQAEYGVELQTSRAVVACEDTPAGAEVTLAGNEKLLADKVVICSGYVFNLLFPDIYRSSGLIVSKLQMLKTHPMPEVKLGSNILTGLTIRRYESFEQCPSFSRLETPEHLRELKQWGIHILFKQGADGSIIIGDSHEYAGVGEVENLGLGSKEFIDELMLKEAARIVDFNVQNIAQNWAGLYAQHPNEIFEHDISSNIHIRTGIGGKGMSSGAGYAGEVIAGLF